MSTELEITDNFWNYFNEKYTKRWNKMQAQLFFYIWKLIHFQN